MSAPHGRTVPLSPARLFLCDLVHHARKLPTSPVQRRMNLAPLLAMRRIARPCPSWCAVFLKAYAFVCAGCPELRRAYLPFPRPRLYEHPEPVACIAVERRLDEEDAVFCGRLGSPEKQGLLELDAQLRRLEEEPVETISQFRRALQSGRFPRALRRALWWLALNTSGRKRAEHLGTYAVCDYSALGASALHPVLPLTTTLSFDVIQPDGRVDVRLTFDHRAVTGGTAARALADLERVLQNEIMNEMGYFQALDAA